MSDKASYFWDVLGDQWDGYSQKDQIATLWDGYVEIASDLLLQLFQANLSRSLPNIPVFRRYRWLGYRLNLTKAPPDPLIPFKFCYDLGNTDILSIPRLSDQVREAGDDEYFRVINGSNGFTVGGNRLVDSSGIDFVSAGVRAGDSIVFTSGTNLEASDTDVRFHVAAVEASDTLLLDVNNLPDDLTVLRYYIDRSPLLPLIEDTHYIVGDGVICLDNFSLLNEAGTADAWRTVDQLVWAGEFVRDDPRISTYAVRPTATNAASVAAGGRTLVDTTANFPGDGVVPGDYLVLRPSGVSPTQILTSRQVFRIVSVPAASPTKLDVQGTFPLTANQLTYDILRPSTDTFQLISTEDGTAEFPRAYAFQTLTSGSTVIGGSFVAPDLDILVGSNFSSVVLGSPVRLLAGDSLATSDLDNYTITEYIDSTHVRLDRPVSAASTGVWYLVGEILTISSVADVDPSDYSFDATVSNNLVTVDGTIRFVESETLASPYIEYQRQRAASVAQAIQGDPVVDKLWAPETIVDQDQLFQNFGFPIQVNQPNSPEYKNVLQGLWYAYWNGPSIENMVIGLNLVFDLPFAAKSGVVTDVSIPDTAFLVGSVVGPVFDVSAANNSMLLAFSLEGQPPVYVVFPNDPAYPAASVIADIDAAAGQPVASLTVTNRIRISGLTSVKIDTVIGNPGLGFLPGQEDFGIYNVTLLGDDGVSDTYEFGSQFPTGVVIGQRVDKFEPLTTAVGIFDNISLPNWWDVFNIAQINSSIETFSQEDRDIINMLHGHFTFAVRVVADAFAQLGAVDRSVIKFFLEQIKPTISDYLFIVATQFYEIISVTDDPVLLGLVASLDSEYITQRAGQSDSLHLDINISTDRDIVWNVPNIWIRNNPVHPVFGNRANFDVNYHLPAFDDARLSTEESIVTDSGQARLLDGVALVTPKEAVVKGTLAAQYFNTAGNFVLVRQFVPFVFPAFSAPVLRADQVVAEANAYMLGLVGQPIMRLRPDMTLELFVPPTVSGAPRIQIYASPWDIPQFGFTVPGTYIGAGTNGVLSSDVF